MAINIISDEKDRLEIELNKGHLRAIDEIRDIWNIKDRESVISFAIAVLNISKPENLLIKKDSGIIETLVPADKIVK